MSSKFPGKATSYEEITFSVRHPPYTYLHLSIKTFPSTASTHYHSRGQPGQDTTSLDAITALQYLNSALIQYLGLTGAAVPIDILKVENQDVWIRVAREEGSAVTAAVSQWSSGGKTLKIKGRASWLGALVTAYTMPKEGLFNLEM